MKKNPQSKANKFRKPLSEKTAVQKKLDAKVESGKITFKDYFRRSLKDSTKPKKHGLAEFLCNKVSLQNVLKEASAMALNASEADEIRAEALRVKFSIENSLTANTIKHAAQLAFIAGLRWMQIFWDKSHKGQGAPVQEQWINAEQIFKANKGITAGQLWIKCGRPGNFDSFKRMLSRKRKNW